MSLFPVKMQSALPILLASLTVQVCGRPAAPAGQLVNGVSQPLAIEQEAVRFTWRSEDGGRRAEQTAYQLLVSTNAAALAAGKPDWWDSGKVDSAKSASVEYGGKALPPATRVWWEVRVWDQTGKPGPYSAPAFFDTGLNQHEWTAHWSYHQNTKSILLN